MSLFSPILYSFLNKKKHALLQEDYLLVVFNFGKKKVKKLLDVRVLLINQLQLLFGKIIYQPRPKPSDQLLGIEMY